jgi:protein O-mannosyl-transferase
VVRSTINWQSLIITTALFCATFCVFLPCLRNDFSNFDDPVYITYNGHVHHGFTWSAIRWAFGSFYAANWHPITWLSHIADCSMFGKQAWGHHLTNIVFHSANVVLLFLLFSHATGSIWRSAVVAIFFGVHPLHVESVAWVAERKDVLNAFFSLLTLLAYVHWTTDVDRRSKTWYLVSLLCYALSLGSKAMSVTLPVILLLLDFWPLRRLQSRPAIKRAFVEKIPFAVFALAICVVTMAAQRSGGAIKADVPLWVRFANAAVSIARYLGKLFWPHNMIVFYPYVVPSSAVIAWSTLLLTFVSVATLLWRRSCPWLFVGWWWFVISLVPVIGLIQIGAQAMADRYTYWPSVGAFVAIVWGAARALENVRAPRPVVATLACLFVTGSAAGTMMQISFWRNSETLFNHALAIAPDNSLAHLNLGVALEERGALSEGLPHLRKAADLAPKDPETHLNLGMALDQSGDLVAAIYEFQIALRIKPDYAKAHANLAIVLQKQNNFQRAIDEYREALRLAPGSPEVHLGFGLALQQTGQIDTALSEFERAIKQDPSYAAAHSNRGIVLEKVGRLEESIAEYRTARKLDPKNADASLNLPVALFKADHVEEAIEQARELIKQRPDYPEAYFNLGGMLYSKSDFDGAIKAYQQALKLKPDYPDAQHNLTLALEEERKR